MKVHTTNYYNTLITPAEDCPAKTSEIPPVKGDKKSIANYQFELLINHPYQYTSDDLLFTIHAQRNDIPHSEHPEARANLFSKGQPCLRTSPLTKRYGWCIHSNAGGKIALVASNTAEYKALQSVSSIREVRAMRTGK